MRFKEVSLALSKVVGLLLLLAKAGNRFRMLLKKGRGVVRVSMVKRLAETESH